MYLEGNAVVETTDKRIIEFDKNVLIDRSQGSLKLLNNPEIIYIFINIFMLLKLNIFHNKDRNKQKILLSYSLIVIIKMKQQCFNDLQQNIFTCLKGVADNV